MNILNTIACKHVSGADVIITDFSNHKYVCLTENDIFNYIDGRYSFTLSMNGITNMKGPGAHYSPNDVFNQTISFGNTSIFGYEKTQDKAYFYIT